MEDVRFRDPYDLYKASTTENKLVLLSEASDTQQQEQSSPILNSTTPLESAVGEQPLNYVYNNSDSKESTSPVDSNNQGKLSFVFPFLLFDQISSASIHIILWFRWSASR